MHNQQQCMVCFHTVNRQPAMHGQVGWGSPPNLPRQDQLMMSVVLRGPVPCCSTVDTSIENRLRIQAFDGVRLLKKV